MKIKYNTASQKLYVFAWDTTTGIGKSADSANITAYVSKDFGTLTQLSDTSATEVSSTNAKGWYIFDLAQAETEAYTLLFTAKSSTSNVEVKAFPSVCTTEQYNATSGYLITDTGSVDGERDVAANLATIVTDYTADGLIRAILVTYGGAPKYYEDVISGLSGQITTDHGSGSYVAPTASSIRSAMGLASANLDTQLSELPSGVWSYGTRYLTQSRSVAVPSIQKNHRQIVQGDTYGTSAKAFNVLASDGGEWPTDLSTYTWTCTITKDADNENSGTSSLTGTVTAPVATGSSRYLAVALTATQTAAMALGRYNYDLQGSSGATRWTVEIGTVDVVEDVT